MSNPFLAKEVTGIVIVPESFEHEDFADTEKGEKTGKVKFPNFVIGAEIEIKSMNSDDATKLRDESKKHTLDGGRLISVVSEYHVSRNVMKARIVNWENMRDFGGKNIECNEENKKATSAIPGFLGDGKKVTDAFQTFVIHYGTILDRIRDEKAEEAEKNCFKSLAGCPAGEKRRSK